jgi:hypothetical protein
MQGLAVDSIMSQMNHVENRLQSMKSLQILHELNEMKSELGKNELFSYIDYIVTTIKDVNDDIFSKSQKNTICFKGDPDIGGHWVYVDKKGQPQSTYENNLIYQEDDGVCHGAAMIYALGYDKTLFPLIDNTKNKSQFKNNYRSLVSFYIYHIESKKWESSFNYYFQGIKNRKAKINKSLDTLKDFRDKF